MTSRPGSTSGSGLPTLRIEPLGEGAVLVSLSDVVSLVAARRARVLAARIAASVGDEAGWEPPVQGVASVLVRFDPVRVPHAIVRERVAAAAAGLPEDPGPDPDRRIHDLDVRYGGDDGPDLAAVAALAGLTTADVVDRHAAAPVEVLALGFAPGFGYLGLIDATIAVPRRATPRTLVARGSVALAERMTAVYPADSPGGWQVIGRTDVTLFDPRGVPPALLRPGDLVRFRPVRR